MTEISSLSKKVDNLQQQPYSDRQLIGYASEPPNIEWPDGSRLAINFVLNYEEGSEYSVIKGDSKTDIGLTEVFSPRVPEGIRDMAAESMFEYGSRVGFWRLYDLFKEKELPLTIFACALALENNPRVVKAISESEFDVVCHGWRWIEHYLLSEDEERDQIAKAYDSILELLGKPLYGWYSRYGPSPNTRRLLVEHGGFFYDSDAYNDELPYWVTVSNKAHLVIPYSLTTNDAKFVTGAFATGQQFAEFLIDTFDILYKESIKFPRIMSIGLHPRVIGHPGRIVGLIKFLDHLSSHKDVWVCNRNDIATHWKTVVPIKN